MPSRTIRYQPILSAVEVLADLCVADFEPNNERGVSGTTRDGHTIEIYPESFNVKITCNTSDELDMLRSLIEDLFEGIAPRNRLAQQFVDPADCYLDYRYLQSLLKQINDCYSAEAFDAVAVLMRRVLETLLIECFEHHRIPDQIKNSDNNYFMLSEIIQAAETVHADPAGAWNLGRNTRASLTPIKELGDSSAHARRALARKTEVDGLKARFKAVVTDLSGIAST